MNSEILRGMIMAIWACGWADAWENALTEDNKGKGLPVPSGCDIMDYCGEPQQDLRPAATKLYRELEQLNKVNLECLCARYGWDRDLFGHYLAMEGLGHGVGWWDDSREIDEFEFPFHTIDAYISVNEVEAL